MAITGKIKLFEPSQGLFRNGATAVASSNTSLAQYLLSMNREIKWVSSGSDDTTTETITITLPASVAIDRIMLVGHNLKEFTVQYGGSPSDFANVTGIDGALGGGIAETAFTQDTAYYEFDSVTTDTIVITATKTQTVDAEKEITIVIPTSEIGTFAGYPAVRPKVDRNERIAKTEFGKSVVQKGFETFECKLDIDYSGYQADIDLLDTLFDREENFLIWLCGGRYGSDYFRATQRTWRLRDVYNVQTTRSVGTAYRKNIYTSSPNTGISVVETVDG